MRLLLLLVVAACSNPTPSSTPAPKPTGSAATPVAGGDLDSGTFATMMADKTVASETFTIKRAGANVIIRAKSVDKEDPENRFTDGEIELDANNRPVRAAYRRVTPADGFEYRLGGTPLTLDVTRDDKNHPQHIVAGGAVDTYLTGPGFAAMTPLCKVTGDVVLTTIGDEDTAWTHHVEAYRAAPVGALQRIIVDAADMDFDVLCDGERLVAGGISKVDFWFVRSGREADLAALKVAPRPPAKQWKHPVVESEPWDPLHTFLFDGFIVTRDRRSRTNRLTVFDLKDGKELVHRDFTVPLESHVMCEAMPGAKLVCQNAPTKYFQILDARTLADQVDLAPAITDPGESWSIVSAAKDRVVITVDAERAFEIDVAKRVAKSIPMPENRYRGTAHAALCPRTLGDPVKVGGAAWTIDQTADTATLVRKAGKKTLPPIELAFDHPSLLTCTPKTGGAYVVTHAEAKSVLGALNADGTVRWKVDLGAHPGDVYVLGPTLVMTMSDEARRVLSIDATTGKISWVASGPLPKK